MYISIYKLMCIFIPSPRGRPSHPVPVREVPKAATVGFVFGALAASVPWFWEFDPLSHQFPVKRTVVIWETTNMGKSMG